MPRFIGPLEMIKTCGQKKRRSANRMIRIREMCTNQVGILKTEDFPLSIFLKGVALARAPSVCRKSRSGDQREASLRREA